MSPPGREGESPVQRHLQVIRAHYVSGDSGHHPHVVEAVVAAIDSVITLAGDTDVASIRAALTVVADKSAASAARNCVHAQRRAGHAGVAIVTYLAAWSAATADELRRVIRAVETEFAALP